ncbi:MAG: hypothetical protein ACE5LU_22925 [Anaerolineae bacterium]
MNSRRAEIMALCALILAAAAFTLMLHPILLATAGPLNQGATTAATATPSIPRTFTYQGILRHPDGNVYTSDVYPMTIRLYNKNGKLLYTEPLDKVAIRDGWFTVVLGDKKPITADLLYTAPLYLEVEVDGRRLKPHQRIHAVPQALLAAQALEASHAVQADQAAQADTAKALSKGATVDGLSSAVNINKAGDATAADESFAHPVQIRGGNQRVQFGVDPARKVAYLQSTEDGGRTRDIVLNPRGGNVAIGPMENELARARLDSFETLDLELLTKKTGVPEALRELLLEKSNVELPPDDELDINKTEGKPEWHVIVKLTGQTYRIEQVTYRIIEQVEKEVKEIRIISIHGPKATLDVNGDIRGKLQYTDEVTVSDGTVVNADTDGDGIGDTSYLQKDLNMAADKGFCFITHFSTTLGGGGENAAGGEVAVVDGKWVVRTARGSENADAHVRARCAGIVD